MLKLILCFLSGIFAGFINVNAGGGAVLTLPALILLGLPPAVANGTNRIGVFTGALSSTLNFKSKGIFEFKPSLTIALPASIGAIAGAFFAVNIPDRVFNIILSAVMISVLAVILFRSDKITNTTMEDNRIKHKKLTFAAFIAVGFYGGFIQTGVGLLIMSVLAALTGFSLLKINSIKMFIVAIYTLVAMFVFIYSGKINFVYGILLAAGNALGGYMGSNYAVKSGNRCIKAILILSVVIMAAKLFFSSF